MYSCKSSIAFNLTETGANTPGPPAACHELYVLAISLMGDGRRAGGSSTTVAITAHIIFAFATSWKAIELQGADMIDDQLALQRMQGSQLAVTKAARLASK